MALPGEPCASGCKLAVLYGCIFEGVGLVDDSSIHHGEARAKLVTTRRQQTCPTPHSIRIIQLLGYPG